MKPKRLNIDGPIKWTNRRTYYSRLGVYWAHGKNGCSVVLKTEASWRTISGLFINTPWGSVWVYVRNWRI